MQWLNPAPQWAHDGNTITITAGPQTDFWRITHDGGTRDNGHFYYQPVTGDFVAEAKFSADYNSLYDQAGLMVRLDERTWIKCGIEYLDGVQQVSAVVTRDFSDWSIIALPDPPPDLSLRIKQHGNAVEVHFSLDGATYAMLRQAYFPPEPTVQIGVMACAPIGEGFTATFEGFAVRAGE